MSRLRPSRRQILAAGAAGAAFSSGTIAREAEATADELARIERETGGRLGLAAFDTGSGQRVAYRADERFPLCSSFKLLAAGLILARVDRREERLDRRIAFGPGEVVTYSPVTGPRAGSPEGMTVAEICGAAITRSDNTAGNLMLASFGGPSELTAYLRSLGDRTTRLDRTETALNEALPDDPRDTTSPLAMTETMHQLLLEDVLSDGSRAQLLAWLDANETGAARIRAASPPGWAIGDKTGTGDRGAACDVAILRPPGRDPILLAIYLHGSAQPIAGLNAAIAASAKVALTALSAI